MLRIRFYFLPPIVVTEMPQKLEILNNILKLKF